MRLEALEAMIMAMKTINVAALKSSLSRCLRAAQSGERFVVMDRTRPLAELGPPKSTSSDPFERLASLGKVKLGKQDWRNVEISPLRRPVPVAELLKSVRADGQ